MSSDGHTSHFRTFSKWIARWKPQKLNTFGYFFYHEKSEFLAWKEKHKKMLNKYNRHPATWDKISRMHNIRRKFFKKSCFDDRMKFEIVKNSMNSWNHRDFLILVGVPHFQQYFFVISYILTFTHIHCYLFQ